MTVDEFVWAVTGSGTSNFMDADEIEDYCPVHGYDVSFIGDLYHEDGCPAYAAKLNRLNGG